MSDVAGRDQPTDIRCRARVVSVNGQAIVRLPDEASAALPSRGQVAVTGTVAGTAFRTVVEPDGRRGHWIKVDPRTPWGRNLAPGDVVSVVMSPAPEWPEPVVPDDLQAALDAAPDVAGLWTSITPMSRWEWVRWVAATRNPETRSRRVEGSISRMRSGKRRPCCFDLSACTDPDLARSGTLMAPDGE